MQANITQNNITQTDNSVQFPVDPEPFGFRLTLVIILIIGIIVGYLLISALFSSSGFNILAIIGGILFGALILQIAEYLLKPYWKSNRFLHITADKIALISTKTDEIYRSVMPSQQVNVYMWYFEITKRSRAPKGWYVVSITLEQDDIYLPVFALMSQDDYKSLKRSFTKLKPKSTDDSGDRDLRLAGQQRRLYIAESARGLEGSEMLKANFEQYIEALETRFPQWMPSTRK